MTSSLWSYLSLFVYKILWGKMVAKGIHLSDDFDETQLAGFMASEVLKVLEADLLRLAWLDGTKTGDVAYNIFKNGGFIKQMKDSAETDPFLCS